jgi:hypothetical protein
MPIQIQLEIGKIRLKNPLLIQGFTSIIYYVDLIPSKKQLLVNGVGL